LKTIYFTSDIFFPQKTAKLSYDDKLSFTKTDQKRTNPIEIKKFKIISIILNVAALCVKSKS
jgi:hypothetical protein